MDWKTIDTAPKDGTVFLAWYVSEFGPQYGPMRWELEKKGGGRFHSFSMGTQTKCATHWAYPNIP